MSIVRQNNTPFSVEVKLTTITSGAVRTNVTDATAGLEIRYWTGPDGAVTTLTPAPQTSGGTHVNGGIVHKYGGIYRVDVPAINAPGETVTVALGGLSDTYCQEARVQLTPFNPAVARVAADMTHTNGVELKGNGTEANKFRSTLVP
jgi:hypothetical protein